MAGLQKERFIRQKAVENQGDPGGSRIYWSRHAIGELVNDNLARSDVEQALIHAEIIEDNPIGHRPLPDCLVLTYRSNKQPLHAVVAIDQTKDRIFIVTAYIPSANRWHHDWRTRK